MQKRLSAWTQTPICAWLASVPIVAVSQNDNTERNMLQPHMSVVSIIQHMKSRQQVLGLEAVALEYSDFVLCSNVSWKDIPLSSNSIRHHTTRLVPVS